MKFKTYKTKNGIIVVGDSLEVLKKIKDNIFGLCVTSPPYNNATKYENYDDNLEYNTYLNYMKNVFKEVYRVLEDNGRLAINLPFVSKNPVSNEKNFLFIDYHRILLENNFIPYDVIIWVKGTEKNALTGYTSTAWGSWCSPSSPNMRSISEVILVYSKKGDKYIKKDKTPDITPEEFKEYTRNIYFIQSDREKYEHPCTYPVELVYRLIKLYTYPEDYVLDPFAGVGSTGVAAKRTNRKFLLIDKSQEYCYTSYNRIISEPENII